MDPMLIVAGAVTGLLVGLTGVGGGAMMTPLLLLVFGVAPLSAVGTDLWFAAITKLFASRVHHGHALIDWQVVRRLWLGSLTASALTLVWMKWQPVDATAVSWLKTAIAVAVMVTAAGMLLQKRLQALGRKFRTTDSAHFKALQAPVTVLAGVVLGVLVTLTSVGAGALGAVFLAYLYPLRLTPPRLIATDIVHAIPLAVFAGMGHLWLGNVSFGLLGQLLLGSIPAVMLGAMLSARLPHALLRGVDMKAIMAEMFGKQAGCSRGHGGSMHLFDRATRFYGGQAIVGGGLPLAVGLALADKLSGRRALTACFFGEGAVAEGAFHEAMNLAALWHLPVLFCCENNLYAMRRPTFAPRRRLMAWPRYRSTAWTWWRCTRPRWALPSRCCNSAGRCFWSSGPSVFAPIRCSTPSFTATSRRCWPGKPVARSTPSARA